MRTNLRPSHPSFPNSVSQAWVSAGRRRSAASSGASPRIGFLRIALAVVFLLLPSLPAFSADSPRQIIAAAIIEEDDAKKASLIASLSGDVSPEIPRLLAAWKEDAIYLCKEPDDKLIPILLGETKDADGRQPAIRLDNAAPLTDSSGQPIRLLAADLDTAAHDSNLRAVMKGVLDLQALVNPDPAKRILAIGTLGMAQDAERLPALLLRQSTETDSAVKRALREGIITPTSPR